MLEPPKLTQNYLIPKINLESKRTNKLAKSTPGKETLIIISLLQPHYKHGLLRQETPRKISESRKVPELLEPPKLTQNYLIPKINPESKRTNMLAKS